MSASLCATLSGTSSGHSFFAAPCVNKNGTSTYFKQPNPIFLHIPLQAPPSHIKPQVGHHSLEAHALCRIPDGDHVAGPDFQAHPSSEYRPALGEPRSLAQAVSEVILGDVGLAECSELLWSLYRVFPECSSIARGHVCPKHNHNFTNHTTARRKPTVLAMHIGQRSPSRRRCVDEC